MIILTGSPSTWAATIRGEPEMSKYNARRTVIDGINFDSQAEAMRYSQLKLMQEAGVIRGLERQVSFTLLDSFTYKGKCIRSIIYRADFAYWENGHFVVEDVKGMRLPVYQLKLKMFMSRYPDVDFREVEA
jgi:hypothetical protein